MFCARRSCEIVLHRKGDVMVQLIPAPARVIEHKRVVSELDTDIRGELYRLNELAFFFGNHTRWGLEHSRAVFFAVVLAHFNIVQFLAPVFGFRPSFINLGPVAILRLAYRVAVFGCHKRLPHPPRGRGFGYIVLLHGIAGYWVIPSNCPSALNQSAMQEGRTRVKKKKLKMY